MTTINAIARTETEENLTNAVESLNIDKVQDLLNRFDFNEDYLKVLSLDILQKQNAVINLETACILLKQTSKQTKEETITELRQQGNSFSNILAIQLQERLDV